MLPLRPDPPCPCFVYKILKPVERNDWLYPAIIAAAPISRSSGMDKKLSKVREINRSCALSRRLVWWFMVMPS